MQTKKALYVGKALLLASLIMFVVVGCLSNIPVSPVGTVKEDAFNVTGMVYDANGTSSTGIKGVKVSTPGIKSVTTNSNGFYSIKKLTAGEHKVVFSGEGYASVYVEKVSATADTTIKVWKDVDLNIGMYKLDASFSTTIYALLGDSSTRVLAESVKVQLWPVSAGGLQFTKKYYEFVTDSDGMISADSLPKCKVTLVIPEWKKDGIAYSFGGITVDLAKVSTLGAQDITPRGDFVVKMLSSNVKRGYFSGDSIKVSFSDSMDNNQTIVALTTGGVDVDVNVNWSSSKKSVVITPVKKLPRGTNYNVNVLGWSGDKKYLSWGSSFSTYPAPYIVSGNIIDVTGEGKCNVSKTDTITITVSESLSYVCVVDSNRFETALSSDGKTVSIIPKQEITANMYANLTAADGVKATLGTGEIVTFTVPEFELEGSVAPFLVASNLVDVHGVETENIGVNDTLIFVYSEAVSSDHEVGVLFTGYNGQYKAEVNGDTVRVIPLQSFAAGTTPTIRLTAVSVSGNNIATGPLNINVVPSLDVVTSSVITTNGAVSQKVALDADVVIDFNVPVDVDAIDDDTVGLKNYVIITETISGDTVAVNSSWSNDNKTLTLNPSSDFTASTNYTLRVFATLPSVYPNDYLGALYSRTFATAAE